MGAEKLSPTQGILFERIKKYTLLTTGAFITDTNTLLIEFPDGSQVSLGEIDDGKAFEYIRTMDKYIAEVGNREKKLQEAVSGFEESQRTLQKAADEMIVNMVSQYLVISKQEEELAKLRRKKNWRTFRSWSIIWIVAFCVGVWYG